MNKLVLLLFLCLPSTMFAQLNKDSALTQISYALLPDNGYSLNDVITNNKLAFVAGDSLQQPAVPYYWVKLTIPNPNRVMGQYYLFVNYNLHNILHYFDANAQQWINNADGIMVTKNARFQLGAMPLLIQARDFNTVYIKMDVSGLQKFGHPIKLSFLLQPREVSDRHQRLLWEGWIAALAVVLFFFLYNLYMYFSLGDESTLQYLIVQFGIMIYITSYRYYFNMFFPRQIFTTEVLKNGFVRFYDLNNLLTHIAVMVIMYGFVQLTRSYLNTQKYLPRANALLKYGLYIYTAASAVLIIINTFFVYIDSYTLLYDNLFLFLLISCLIYTAIAGYRKKLRASGPFLLANLLPLGLMTGITLFHVLAGFSGDNNVWLPTLAIVSQAFCFSVVLVARTRLIQNDLKASEMEAQRLTLELKQIALQHSLVELENQKINLSIQHEKTRSELLRRTLEANQRELASTTLYMVQKNELLAALKQQVTDLKKLNRGTRPEGLPGIESILKTSLNLDDDWAKFKLHFEQVHPKFFENLEAKYSGLTNNEIRLYTYIHIKLSNKEIAALLNIAHDSVRRAKSRLFKKMGLADTQPDS